MFDSPHNIQLTFNSRLKRARLEFRVEECFKSRKPPRQLMARIEERFKEERDSGFIETYLIFNKRFDELWSHLRDLEGDIDPAREIKFTIAQGGRVYSEIQIETSKASGEAALSCKIAPKKMSSIPFNAFLFNVIAKLSQQDFPMAVDRGQMRFLYLMLKNGQALEKVKLLAQPDVDESPSAGFLVRINPQLHYATLHVFNGEWLSNELNCKRLLKEARIALNRVNVDKVKMNFLEGHSIEKITSLISKMQAFGFNMPYDLLIAYDEQYRLNANLLARDKEAGEHDLLALDAKFAKARHRRFKGEHLQIDVDPSAMKAVLVAVDDKIVKLRPTLNDAWLREELTRAGLVSGFEEQIPALLQALQTGEGLAGFVVAKGVKAVPGTNLALKLMNKVVEVTDEQIDIRERQNHRIVHTGDVVAEVRYTDGVEGINVLGEKFFARGSASVLGTVLGGGVEIQHDGVFTANRDGLLQLDGSTLSVQSAYVHKGSINLSSGNLRFDGAVVVEGDIESGASVDITGTLIVKGSVVNAKIRCTGDLEVKGGVLTGKNGYINVGGNARMGFVENSVIQVKGNLLVQRMISHSWITAGGLIEVLDESKGQITGGLLSSWKAIVCAKFGSDQGHTTQCRIGSNFHDEIRLQRLAKRAKRFNEAAEENARSIALLEKPGSKLSEAQKQHYDYIKKNGQRYGGIIARIVASRTALESSLTYNLDATIVVSDILDKNSLIWVNGKKIKMPTSLKGVLLSTHVNKGILDLSQVEDFHKAHPAAIFGHSQS